MARTYDEVATTKTEVVRTEDDLGLGNPTDWWQTWHTAQAGLSAGCVGTGITPHIPVLRQRRSTEDGTFSRSDRIQS